MRGVDDAFKGTLFSVCPLVFSVFLYISASHAIWVSVSVSSLHTLVCVSLYFLFLNVYVAPAPLSLPWLVCDFLLRPLPHFLSALAPPPPLPPILLASPALSLSSPPPLSGFRSCSVFPIVQLSHLFVSCPGFFSALVKSHFSSLKIWHA